MKYIFGRIVAYTVLYVTVIFGIFIFQFTKGKTFSFSSHSVYVSGRYEMTETGNKRPLLPIHITTKGLNVYISEEYPIYAVYTQDIPPKILKVQAYTTNKNLFSIQCSEDVTISFFSEQTHNTTAVKIVATIPPAIQKIVIPWKITQNAAIERQNGQLFVRYKKKQYSFSGGFAFNAEHVALPPAISRTIPVLIFEKNNTVAYYKTYIPETPFNFAAAAQTPAASVEMYTEKILHFTDTLLQTAKKEAHAHAATELLSAAYLAEMGKRGFFKKGLQTMPIRALRGAKHSYRTNPFFYELQKTHTELMSDSARTLTKIQNALEKANPEIFETASLLPFLINRKKIRTIDRVVSFAEQINTDTITVRQAAGILELWADCTQYYPNKLSQFDTVISKCEKKITKCLQGIRNQMFLSEDSIHIHTKETAEITRILIKYGKHNNILWQAIARSLITSLLSFLTDSAALPASFTITGSSETEYIITPHKTKTITAGILYPLIVTDNNWYPHEQSLALQSEPGIWAWTAAEDIEVLKSTRKEILFRVKFPKNASHYMTLHGIRPFYRIEMYGISFRSDARFEYYNSSGYMYNSKEQTLYLKMHHKNEYEFIKLSFS